MKKKSRVQNPLGLFRYQRIIVQTHVLPINSLRKHKYAPIKTYWNWFSYIPPGDESATILLTIEKAECVFPDFYHVLINSSTSYQSYSFVSSFNKMPCLLSQVSDILDPLFHYPRVLVSSYTVCSYTVLILLCKRLCIFTSLFFIFFYFTSIVIVWNYLEVKKTDNRRISFKTNLIIVTSIL